MYLSYSNRGLIARNEADSRNASPNLEPVLMKESTTTVNLALMKFLDMILGALMATPTRLLPAMKIPLI